MSAVKYIIILLIISTSSLLVFGQNDEFYAPQDEPEEPTGFKDRLFIGGNLGLQIGQITIINASPLLGIQATKMLSVGLGASYLYYNDRIFQFESHVYGGRAFAQHIIYKYIFAHAEFQLLNLNNPNVEGRINTEGLLLGAGFRQTLGGNAFVNILALWEVLGQDYYPYRNPIIRAGFQIGL